MPESMMVADQLNCESDLFAMFSSQDTTLPMKVQWTLGFIHIKIVLGFVPHYQREKPKMLHTTTNE